MALNFKPFVATLKVVKMRLARYEAGEIAHIENVMASETRNRDHRSLRRTEEFISIETVREEENTRDLRVDGALRARKRNLENSLLRK
jgi:hypothetical protein